MKLIIIHGAEATGKLTVAKSLASLSGIGLFHNHLSVDVTRTLFDFGDPRFSDLIWDVRLTVFEHAARADIDLIFTWAFSSSFMRHLERIEAVLKPYDAEICSVFLQCDQDERERRVISVERRNKIHTVEKLRQIAITKDYAPIPNALEIDNTHRLPKDVASQIINHFALQTVRNAESANE